MRLLETLFVDKTISDAATEYSNIIELTLPRKLLDQVRDARWVRHYAYRTEESCVQWIRRYILFHNKHHPKDMAEPDVQTFLTHLVVEGNVAASTQNQALSALLFLYRVIPSAIVLLPIR